MFSAISSGILGAHYPLCSMGKTAPCLMDSCSAVWPCSGLTCSSKASRIPPGHSHIWHLTAVITHLESGNSSRIMCFVVSHFRLHTIIPLAQLFSLCGLQIILGFTKLTAELHLLVNTQYFCQLIFFFLRSPVLLVGM